VAKRMINFTGGPLSDHGSPNRALSRRDAPEA
jgi:hypothetical protein